MYPINESKERERLASGKEVIESIAQKTERAFVKHWDGVSAPAHHDSGDSEQGSCGGTVAETRLASDSNRAWPTHAAAMRRRTT